MKTAVFFDVDDTIIDGQTQKLLVFYLYRQKKISFIFLLNIYLWFLFYKMGIVSKDTSIMIKSYRLVKGLQVREFKNLLLNFFEKEIKTRIYPQAIERINFHKNKGHEIVLISKSINILIETIKDYLNVSMSISTELEVKDGVFTGEINGDIIHGKEKVKAIKKLIPEKNWNLENSYAYGDHCSDFPILEIVGYPAIVNPSRRLKKEAKKRNWTTYFWKL